ncbi:hypothetical protein R83H12_00656 [Fibrobacteria bacterium R8-3-H12]
MEKSESKIDFLAFIGRKNISRVELADILDVNRSSISQYISMAHGAKYEKILKLVELGITPEELFGLELGQKMRNDIIAEYLSSSDFGKNLKVSEDEAVDIVRVGLSKLIGNRNVFKE